MNRLCLSIPRIKNSGLKLGAFAGLAGGAAEIAWVLLYSGLGNADPNVVAQGVTSTFSSAVAASSVGVQLGILIHMTIAILLGIAIAMLSRILLPPVRSMLLEPCFVISSLAGVWALNFHLVLPLINPQFVHLLPLEVSLTSKVLFGVAAAFVFSVANYKKGRIRSS